MAEIEIPDNSVHSKTRSEWRDWLESHHTQPTGVWLISYKKATGLAYVDYDSAVEEALCFGWIDSVPRKLDDMRSMLYFAPRKTGSGWSRLNKQRIDKMLDADLMMPAGLAKLEVAKQDGSWTALDAVENLEIPDDLAAAFAEYDQAASNFEAFPRSAKRGILEWISNAKRPTTRAKRIAETAELAQQNIRANQWPKRNP
ncbi:MAG: YdeI/OmpD-associated family protein [Deinococcota bacterium]